MSRKTMGDIIAFAQRVPFETIDITGGAVELNPDIRFLLHGLEPLTPKLMIRSNLTALDRSERMEFMKLCKTLNIVIIASLPSTNESETNAQRGGGVFNDSIETLKMLNDLGYGRDNTGLELNLVANPSGALLPLNQVNAEKKFKHDLQKKWDIHFNKLFTLANMPLGRFQYWLTKSDEYERYMHMLVEAFNPATIEGLMCRSLISVSWDGYLYDCDFNLAKGLYMDNKKIHISQLKKLPGAGLPIMTGEHCYACTADAGST
jgi:radical SAM/Cys-rich protein